MQASGDENTALEVVAKQQTRGRSSRLRQPGVDISAWAESHKDLIASLQHRIGSLLIIA